MRRTLESPYSAKNMQIKNKYELTLPSSTEIQISALGNIELTDDEERQLETVIRRFEDVRKTEENRIKKMRANLIKKEKTRNDPHFGDFNHCSICGRTFITFFYPRLTCQHCDRNVCSNCLWKKSNHQGGLCKNCHNESLHKGMTGLWFLESLRLAKAEGRIRSLSGPEALRASIIRLKKYKYNTNYNISGSESCYSGSEIVPPHNNLLHTNLPIDELNNYNYGSKQTDILQDDRVSYNRSNFPTINKMNKLEGGMKVHHRRLASIDSHSTISVASGLSYGTYSSFDSDQIDPISEYQDISGQLQFSIDYNETYIRIFIKKARNIKVVDFKNQTTNSYVKTYLLPDKTKSGKRKSSLKKDSINPVFNEELRYKISRSELAYRTLQLSMWHHHTISADIFLGEIFIPLASYSFSPTANWHQLEAKKKMLPFASDIYINKGSISLSIKYVTANTLGTSSERDEGNLLILINSAKIIDSTQTNTLHPNSTNKLKPYMKSYLLPFKPKDSKRKTKVLRKTSTPTWNETIVYTNIPKSRLSAYGVELTMWDAVRLSSNEFLGGCRLNIGSGSDPCFDATGHEQSAWLAMISKPDVWIEATINLRSHMN